MYEVSRYNFQALWKRPPLCSHAKLHDLIQHPLRKQGQDRRSWKGEENESSSRLQQQDSESILGSDISRFDKLMSADTTLTTNLLLLVSSIRHKIVQDTVRNP
jgi:hypothetical protein